MQSSNTLSNPIYQHSGETQKLNAIAKQASITEDMEQRRRLFDGKGEDQKINVAKEVAQMVDDFGSRVQLKHTPTEIPSEPLLEKAQHAASNAASAATNAASNAAQVATNAASNAASTATGLLSSTFNSAKNMLNSATTATMNAAVSTVHLGQDAAGYAVHLGQDAAGYVSHAAHEAAHQASDLSKKATDATTSLASTAANKTSALASTAVDKTKELAGNAVDKAYEVADNINHFTTLVSVLAEEEKERTRRLVSGDEAQAAANAFKVSELVRNLGPSFYKQTPNLAYQTRLLDDIERRWRLSPDYSTVAENNAHQVGKLVSKKLQHFNPRYHWIKSAAHEEKERLRRLSDVNQTNSILNAFKVSDLIRDLGLGFYRQEGTFNKKHAGYATTLLEEIERRDRIAADKLHHAADHVHMLSDVVANNMEKFNYSTRQAAQFATEVAGMLSSVTKKAASNLSIMTQDLAKNATAKAKEVASDVSSYSTRMYVIALEERERTRRLADSDESTSINNAWRQSALIRNLDGLYRSSSVARFPVGLLEEQERKWRMTQTPSASKKLNEMVLANVNKFLSVNTRIEHALDTAAHSKLNANSRTFVPHVGLTEQKHEPIVASNIARASGAQC